MNNERWILPEGIAELLPPQAQQMEQLRRTLLDMYHGWGYELVIPPLIEYLESLLIGTADDLDLQTFKLTDQLNGRMMGVRADMTPQVARIDAHLLRRATPTRLCYLGPVLHTRPDGFAGSRSPMQVGAELYGHSGIESDVEIIELMIETLRCSGVTDVYLDLGHVGIFRGLMQQCRLSMEQEKQLFDALQRKAKPEIQQMLDGWKLPVSQARMLEVLADLNGGEEVFTRAHSELAAADASVQHALDDLKNIAVMLRRRFPKLTLHYDLAELRGYHYHTGVVFAAFVAGQGQAVAQGGRYDGIGHVFGNARPATGFSSDMRTLLNFVAVSTDSFRGIFAPALSDVALLEMVRTLRQQGERVVMGLPGQAGTAKDMACDRQLVKQGDHWIVKSI